MPVDAPRPEDAGKLYYSIREVSELLEVKPHVLRYWESQFRMLRPKKSRAGNRMYRPKDVDLLREIQRLLHVRRYTIAGARQELLSRRRADYVPDEAAGDEYEIGPDADDGAYEDSSSEASVYGDSSRAARGTARASASDADEAEFASDANGSRGASPPGSHPADSFLEGDPSRRPGPSNSGSTGQDSALPRGGPRSSLTTDGTDSDFVGSHVLERGSDPRESARRLDGSREDRDADDLRRAMHGEVRESGSTPGSFPREKGPSAYHHSGSGMVRGHRPAGAPEDDLELFPQREHDVHSDEGSPRAVSRGRRAQHGGTSDSVPAKVSAAELAPLREEIRQLKEWLEAGIVGARNRG